MHRPLLVTLALPVLLGAAQPEGDVNLPSFELRRDDRTITVQQTARDDEGGISITRGGDCRRDQDISFYYAPNPKRIDTRVNNTRIRSNVVLRSQPKEGGAEAQDRAVLDFFGGSLELNDETGCPRNVRRNAQQRVVITEGRTTVNGASLVYQNATGVGDMAGPVELSRRAAGDSPALTASSSRLSFNVDDDIQTLRGNVQIESEGRTSEADVLELDEEAGFAVLRGNPARSRDEDGEVAGQIIEYDLDSNDVVVRQGVEATFEIDVGDEEETDTALPGFGGSEDGDGSDEDDGATNPEEDGEDTFPEEPEEIDGSGDL
jgi:lipopolysaccharide export system protein LptA